MQQKQNKIIFAGQHVIEEQLRSEHLQRRPLILANPYLPAFLKRLRQCIEAPRLHLNYLNKDTYPFQLIINTNNVEESNRVSNDLGELSTHFSALPGSSSYDSNDQQGRITHESVTISLRFRKECLDLVKDEMEFLESVLESDRKVQCQSYVSAAIVLSKASLQKNSSWSQSLILENVLNFLRPSIKYTSVLRSQQCLDLIRSNLKDHVWNTRLPHSEGGILFFEKWSKNALMLEEKQHSQIEEHKTSPDVRNLNESLNAMSPSSSCAIS